MEVNQKWDVLFLGRFAFLWLVLAWDEVCQLLMRSQLLVFLAKAAGLWSGQVLSQY